MFKQSILAFLLISTINLLAQKPFDRRHKLGISAGLGNSDVYRAKPLDGEAAYNSKGYYLVGVTYLAPIKHWLDIEISAEYSRHNFRGNSAPIPQVYYWNTEASLISFPVSARFNFLRYCYFQAGFLIDLGKADYEFDKQNGLGVLIGLGGKYAFKNGIAVFVNPYLRNHGLLTGRGANSERVLEYGGRVGLLFSIGKK